MVPVTDRGLTLLNKVVKASNMYLGASFLGYPVSKPNADCVAFQIEDVAYEAWHYHDGRVEVVVLDEAVRGNTLRRGMTAEQLAKLVRRSLQAHLKDEPVPSDC